MLVCPPVQRLAREPRPVVYPDDLRGLPLEVLPGLPWVGGQLWSAPEGDHEGKPVQVMELPRRFVYPPRPIVRPCTRRVANMIFSGGNSRTGV